jgi:hypothetical protein
VEEHLLLLLLLLRLLLVFLYARQFCLSCVMIAYSTLPLLVLLLLPPSLFHLLTLSVPLQQTSHGSLATIAPQRYKHPTDTRALGPRACCGLLQGLLRCG